MTRGVKFHLERFFMVKSFINLSTLHCHSINIIITSRLKMCSKTKVWVQNPNMGSKFLMNNGKKFWQIFKTRLLNWSGVYCRSIQFCHILLDRKQRFLPIAHFMIDGRLNSVAPLRNRAATSRSDINCSFLKNSDQTSLDLKKRLLGNDNQREGK